MIHQEISEAFADLAQLNQLIYDYWIGQLYDEQTGDLIHDMWCEDTVLEMERDIMEQMKVSGTF